MCPPAPANAGLRFHPLSAFGHRHCRLCNRPSHFVRLREYRVKIVSQNFSFFFFSWSTWYFLWILLSFQKEKKVVKTKAKSHPYVFSVSGSIFRDTFSTKLPELEMLIRSPTPLHHLSPLPGRCADAPWGCNSCSQCPHGSAAALNTLSTCCA